MAENKIDILIDSLFRGDGFDKAMRSMRRLEQQIALTKKLADFSEIGVSLNKNGRFVDAQTKKFMSYGEVTRRVGDMNAFIDQQKAAQKAMMQTDKALQKSLNSFSMEFLGILFFGMQIQMMFSNLAKSTVSSFMKISEGSTSSGQAINALNASWELLGFTIGSAVATALEMVLPIVLPIIEAVSDWVQQNEKLVGWIVIAGIALGAFMFIVGSLSIGLEAVFNAILKVGAGTSILNKALMEWLAPVAADAGWVFVFSTIAMWIGIIIAIVAVLYAAWITNFAGIQEFTKNTLGIIWDLIKTVFGGLWQIIKTVFEIIVAIFQGDWNRVLKLTGKVLIQIITLIAKMVTQILAILYNLGILAYNIVISMIRGLLKLITSLISGSYELMFTFAQNVIKYIAKPFDFIAEKINAAISVLSKVPGFAWVKKFKIPNSESIINTLGDMKEGLQSIKDLGDSVVDKVFKNKDFASRESIQSITNGIDQLSKKAVDLLKIDEVASPQSTISTDKLSQQFSSSVNAMASFNEQAQITQQSTQNLIELNNLETESLANKNAELERNINLMQQVNSLSVTYRSGDTMAFDRAIGNFVAAPR